MKSFGALWDRLNPLVQILVIAAVVLSTYTLLPASWNVAINEVFNPREKALIVWCLIFVGWSLSQRQIKSAIRSVIKALFASKIVMMTLMIALYTLAVILEFSSIGLWQTGLIKETVFWFIGTAFISAIDYTEITRDEDYFRKKLIDSVKLLVLVEFIVNFYTFSFGCELSLVPALFFLGGIRVIAEHNPEQQSVKKFIDLILIVFGIAVVVHASANLFQNYADFVTLDNVRELLLPSALTIAYLPFLYFWALLVTYDEFFRYVDILLNRDKALAKFTKWQIFIYCRANLRRLVKFKNENMRKIRRLKQKEDVADLVDDFKRTYP